MKKLCFIALALSLTGAAVANTTDKAVKETPDSVTPFSFGIASPIQLPGSGWDVYGLGLNIFYGQHSDLYGIDCGLVTVNTDNGGGIYALGGVSYVGGDFGGIQLAGVGNAVMGRANALQLSGILNYTKRGFIGGQMGSFNYVDSLAGFQLGGFNWVNVDAYGLQLAGLANTVLGGANGFQASGLLNYNRGEFIGAQLSSVNINGSIIGFQAGAYNYNMADCKGFQVGVANANTHDYRGWSIGAVNYTSRFRGLQIGFCNIIADTGRAVQIGAFNAATNFTGVQLGLLNIIEHGPLPIMVVMNAQF